MVSPSPRLRDDVVNLKHLEREIHLATAAFARLLPVEDVLVLSVVLGSVYVRSARYVRSVGHQPIVKQATHSVA